MCDSQLLGFVFSKGLMVKSELWITCEIKKTLIHSRKGSCMWLIKLCLSLTLEFRVFYMFLAYAWISKDMLE